GIGLLLELGGELQLMRAASFSVTALKPNQVQSSGFYQWLENPIYVGIILQLVAWGLWMPLALVGMALNFEALRNMVSNERAELAKIRITHRGMDSFLWN
ncbi:MAG TPA: hypothetical protein VHL11_02985, partial [Phototrophicaceae bacterium]|nr:hypothetical protein [Phototrophicaceae bacterium]